MVVRKKRIVRKKKTVSKKKSVKKKARRNKKRTTSAVRRRRLKWAVVSIALLLTIFGGWLAWLNHTIVKRFNERDLASLVHVYSRPVEWFKGAHIGLEKAVDVLLASGYRQRRSAHEVGDFSVENRSLDLVTRQFEYADALYPSQRVRVRFGKGGIESIKLQSSDKPLAVLLLDPVEVGSLASNQQEDRRVLRLHEVPDRFLKVLLAVEDRRFSSHPGVDPVAIARALIANLRSGRVTQGGSTITQQLVKNLYLNSEQTLTRKITEALYALLLERNFDKDEILEAYINEIFLVQVGNRALHGFELASENLFGRPLNELDLNDYALLVGMIKAPSAYHPRRHPKKALERRNTVLQLLADNGLISEKERAALSARPLRVSAAASRGGQPHAAFLDLVRRQVSERGMSGDVPNGEFKVWSTMDPVIQRSAETALNRGLKRIETARGMKPNTLQGAIVVLRAENGHVLALVGDRRRDYAGFNRALDAHRSVGSLLKPVIALTAFESPAAYTLSSPIDDGPFSIKLKNGDSWAPGNYDGQFHGIVPLATVVEKSYNVASARLGLDVGIGPFVSRLSSLTLDSTPPAYPSALLGAVEMTPLEVARLYLPFANGGLGFPLRAFVSVTDDKRRIHGRFPSTTKRLIAPDKRFLVDDLLRGVVERGTASRVLGDFGRNHGLAGKTGTTDDYRDSWFTGYSANYVVAVWVGRDDNRSTGLSGASGALTIWRDLMQSLPLGSNRRDPPANIEWHTVDTVSGLQVSKRCATARQMPFIVGSKTPRRGACGQNAPDPDERDGGSGRVRNWLESIFSGQHSAQAPADVESGRR